MADAPPILTVPAAFVSLDDAIQASGESASSWLGCSFSKRDRWLGAHNRRQCCEGFCDEQNDANHCGFALPQTVSPEIPQLLGLWPAHGTQNSKRTTWGIRSVAANGEDWYVQPFIVAPGALGMQPEIDSPWTTTLTGTGAAHNDTFPGPCIEGDHVQGLLVWGGTVTYSQSGTVAQALDNTIVSLLAIPGAVQVGWLCRLADNAGNPLTPYAEIVALLSTSVVPPAVDTFVLAFPVTPIDWNVFGGVYRWQAGPANGATIYSTAFYEDEVL